MRLLYFLLFIILTIPNFAYSSCSEDVFLKKLCISKIRSSPLPKSFPCERNLNHSEIVAEFRSAFQVAPVWTKPMLCRFDEIQIISTKDDGDYSAWSYDGSRIVVGVNKNEFHLRKTMKDLGRWFAAGKGRLEGSTPLPSNYGAEDIPETSGVSILTYLAHEIGHLLQSPKNKNIQKKYFWTCSPDGFTCDEFNSNQFGHFDWIDRSANWDNSGIPDFYFGKTRENNKALYQFMLMPKNEYKTLAELDSFHRKIYQSSFFSPWSTPSPVEDFAEGISMLVLSEIVPRWNFYFLDGSFVDVMGRILNPKNPTIKRKLEFIRQRVEDFKSGDYY